MKGNTVSYVVNRNINYTNICSYRCQFCAFAKGKASEDLRGKPYALPLDEIQHRAHGTAVRSPLPGASRRALLSL